jgi:hemerythrin-like metal-binding domain
VSFISWTLQDGMGVAVFDSEHRMVVELANRLHQAVDRGEPDTALRHVLRRLARYSEEHSAHEEEYMRLSGYPDTARHMAAHTALKQEIAHFEANLHALSAHRDVLAEAVMIFIRDLLLEHIRVEDRPLGAHLNAKGIR